MFFDFRIGDVKKLQMLFRQLLQCIIPGETVRMPAVNQFSIGVLGIFIRRIRRQPQDLIGFKDFHYPVMISQVQTIYKVQGSEVQRPLTVTLNVERGTRTGIQGFWVFSCS